MHENARRKPEPRPLGRRAFLARLSLLAAAAALPGAAWAETEGGDFPGGPAALRRDPRYARQPFAPRPIYRETQVFGAGTYQLGGTDLLEAALAGGVRLVVTSPDYGDGAAEKAVGRAVETVEDRVFTVTEIPTAAWEAGNRRVAFHRALRRSLGHLRRGNVEALLIRNAEAEQLEDPEFRAFAQEVRESGLVEHLGVSGQSGGLEKTLARVIEDPLLEVVVFAGYLARFQSIPDLLIRARTANKFLVATMPEEADLWNRNPGWKAEAERRRFNPWNGVWSPGFTRRSLRNAVMQTPAHNVALSLRRPDDVQAVLGK